MRVKLAREGQELLNKVNGKEYLVTKSDRATYAVASMISHDDSSIPWGNSGIRIAENSEIRITAENDICFRLVRDPNPREIPEGYSVLDGTLMHNGQVVTEQGEIVIHRILATVPGKLVLETIPKTMEDGRYTLYLYNPAIDAFLPVRGGEAMPEMTVLTQDEDHIVLGFSHTHTEMVQDGEKEKACEKFDVAGIALLLPRRRSLQVLRVPFPFTTEDVVIVPGRDSEDILVTFRKAVSNEGDVVDQTPATYLISCVGYEMKIFEPFCNGKPVSVTRHWQSEKLFAKMEDRIRIDDVCLPITAKAMAELEGYDHLVDYACGDNRSKSIVVADKLYRTKTITWTHTSDRGEVVTVE